MSLSNEQSAFDDDIHKTREFAKTLGFKSTIGEVGRTEYQQARYVATGRSKTMQSNHLRRLAADLNFYKVIPPMKNEVWINGLPVEDALEILKPIGKFFESLHPKNRWGGNFDKDWSRKDPWVDIPHFERNV